MVGFLNRLNMRKYWLIRGYESGKELFEYKVPYKLLPGKNKIKFSLKMLTAKLTLSDEEIM